jgi:hypothetical protein
MDIFEVLTALQERLKKEEIYTKLKQSFANLALSSVRHCIKRQTNYEAGEKVIKAFFNIYMKQYEIKEIPKGYFDGNDYKQYERILKG